MKRFLCIALVFLLLLSTTACTPSSITNTGVSKIYFNGRTYIEDGGTSFEFIYNEKKDTDIWKRITVSAGDYRHHLEYYGDDTSNPNFIVTNASSIYIREDITLGQHTELTVHGTETPFIFTASQAITGTWLDSSALDYDPQNIFSFFVSPKQYPYVRIRCSVYKGNGAFYLRNYIYGNYYEITDDFRTYLHRIFRDYLGYESL